MAWILLIIAGLFEVAFASCLAQAKVAVGPSIVYWYGAFGICLFCSMALLIKASQHLPMGTAYAVWTGIGAVGTVGVGIWVFKEPVTAGRLFFLSTLIASVVGLKFVSH